MAALGTNASHQSSQADSCDTSVMDLTPQQSCVFMTVVPNEKVLLPMLPKTPMELIRQVQSYRR